MADELHTPNHRWYEPRNHIALAKEDVSKQWIFNSGIQKINAWINSQPWGGGFSPAVLFANNEPGVWYDPFDLTTLFQDHTGTTPVTTPGQTVGLMLDKSKGLTLGPELVTNGDFSDGSTGWTVGAGWSISGGQAVYSRTTGTTTLQQSGYAANKYYKIEFDVIGTTGSIDPIIVYFGDGATIREPFATVASGTTGRISCVLPSNSFTSLVFRGLQNVGSFTATIDNISVKELPGFHATQPNTHWRPQYGIVPAGGRRNLLGRTEEFDNAAWVKRRGTISADAVLAPNGTMTADTFVEDTATGAHDFYNGTGVSVQAGDHTASVYIKPRGRIFVRLIFATGGSSAGAYFDLTTGDTFGVTAGYTASAVLDASGFWRLSLTATFAATGLFFAVTSAAGSSTTLVGLNAAAFDVWGAQLEAGSTATPYQKVTTQFDVTEAGVQSLGYLSFDGVDDFMVTPTITPGVDKAQVFAGVRKLSDATGAVLMESSTHSGVNNNGAVGILAPRINGAASYGVNSRGMTTATADSAANFPAPISNALTCIGDISGDTIALRLDGTQVAQSTADQGAGNYLAYPMYIGSRAGTSLRFKGDLYQLITRFGANLEVAQIESTEAYVAGKTAGVDL